MSTDVRPPIEESSSGNVLNSEEDFDLEKWINYTGLKIREHKPEELEAFEKPFQIGWKRELSIRAQLHSSGKRIVDISYISPCNQIQLRNYVEIGTYLRNDQSCGLEPANFTFAKQPVYKFPGEVIKQQLTKTIKHDRKVSSTHQQNGGMSMPQLTPIANDRSGSESNSLNNSLNNSVAEGRSKRKRTAPTRFDDEEYFETLNKKKLIRSQPATPSTKVSPQTTPVKTNFQPFSPKVKNEKSVEETNREQFESLEKESNSSVKSNKSDQPKQVPNSNEIEPKEITEDIESTCSKKDENSQDQPIQINQLQNESTTNPVTILAPTVNQPASNKPPSKPKSSKKKQTKQANNTTNNDLSNPMLNNSLLVESILQNGNFECEDNDLSDCDLIMDTTATTNLNNDQQLPIPPCSLICAGRAGDLPSLRCSRCLCFFHPQCVRTGVFLKDTKRFVCPNCIQPDDNSNAIEDSTSLFEKSNDLTIDDEASNDNHQITNEVVSNHNRPSKQMNSMPKMIQKSQSFSKHASQSNSQHQKTNGLEFNLMKKKSNQHHRLPQMSRNLMNQTSNHHHHPSPSVSNLMSNRIKMPNQPNMNPQMLLKQTQFNNQLIKKLNQLASLQQDVVNQKSNMTYVSNGTITSSSLASRRTRLDSMNKSLASSQQILESFKRLNSLYQPSSSSSFVNQSGSNNRSLMNNRPINNMRPNQQQRSHPSQYQQMNYRPQVYPNPNEKKYLDYFVRHQNGFKQMVNQYGALDQIFDYLNVPDLIKCKQVNKTFNRLANEKHHWKKLNLKNLTIVDWNYFASKIVEANQAEELSLEGLRMPFRTDSNLEDDLWRSFKSCYKHFDSLNKISFGRISIQHLNYLLTNDETNQSNPIFELDELSIRNLYDQEQSGFFSLKLLNDKLGRFKNLRCLRIESKQGFSNDESTIVFLNSLSESLPHLRSLFLPSLRGFAIEDFEFLTKLTQLECLEIGSCESWTLGDTGHDEVPNESEQDNDEYMNQDEEFMNENSNQENEFGNYDGQKRSLLKKHRGAFKYLSQLRNLKKLSLTDVIIDEMTNQLPLVIERMSNLESLGLGYVTVSPDATQTLNILCNTLKTKLPNLKKFSISTDDPHTNKCCFDLLLKRLDNLEELKWKVSSQVEDDGNCLVPFVKERGLESDLENEDNLDLTAGLNDCIEMVETCYLNEVLQKNLNKTKVFILPQ